MKAETRPLAAALALVLAIALPGAALAQDGARAAERAETPSTKSPTAASRGKAGSAPLSAIDWLSHSMAEPDEPPGQRGRRPSVATTARPGKIDVTPLARPDADAAGVLPPSQTGLPRALWGPASVDDVAARLAAVPDSLLPALRDLFRTILLAEAVPPSGAEDDRLFLARVDRLLAMGALEDADALLRRAGAETPERFRRAFDISLLMGTETLACRRMKALPEISPTYPARIFCLARNGDWHAAAVTLETAKTLGILSPVDDALLGRFLDPEIVADVSEARQAPTPLTFRMLEAIGEPLSTGSLPLAFAWADLRSTRGWKAQIEAAERLARHGALPATTLFGLYLRQAPSASGGVWDRAAAVHALHDALNAGDSDAVAAAVIAAWEELRPAGLHHAFAEQYGAELAQMPLPGAAGELALRIGLASTAYRRIAATQVASERGDEFLLSLARGLPESALAADALSTAVRDGFLAPTPPDAYRGLLDDGRVGEALLKAITQFSEGADGDPDGVAGAIALLRTLGLHRIARRAALDLLMQADEA